MKRISDKQAGKLSDWVRLVKFLSQVCSGNGGGYKYSECCGFPARIFNGAHIVPKGRGGKWIASNCLLVPSWKAVPRCGCHSHHLYGDGLRMGIVAALTIAQNRNEKYRINPNYDGSNRMNPYIE